MLNHAGPLFNIIHTNQNLGKGGAVTYAVNQSKADAILYMDCDLATELGCVDEFMQEFQAKSQIIIGDRTHPNSQTKRMWLRSLLTFILGQLISKVLKVQIRDCQCGFKLFPLTQSIKAIFQNLKTNDYSFDIELLAKASKTELAIKNKEVIWTENRERGLFYITKITLQLTKTILKVKSQRL